MPHIGSSNTVHYEIKTFNLYSLECKNYNNNTIFLNIWNEWLNCILNKLSN